ncbi:MAG: hypothetical protein ACLVIY_07535 [Anaerobutyricum soehngenii]
MQSGYFDLQNTGGKFEFRIYYNEITTAVQLDELKWTLCLGENRLNGNSCHKLERKPLGLGSVKVCIINQTERKIVSGISFGDRK